MSQALTINLPDDIYQQLQQAAKLAQQPLETIVAQSLAHSLPPLLEEIPQAYQADVYPLLAMTDTELQDEVRKTFPRDRWATYEILLEQKKERDLSPQERARLDQLREEADLITFRKAYAAVLLKRRGYRMPVPTARPASC
jgi:hypothetical protein